MGLAVAMTANLQDRYCLCANGETRLKGDLQGRAQIADFLSTCRLNEKRTYHTQRYWLFTYNWETFMSLKLSMNGALPDVPEGDLPGSPESSARINVSGK